MIRRLTYPLVVLAAVLLAGGAAGGHGAGIEPTQVLLVVEPAGALCAYTRPTGKELCTGLDVNGTYPARSGTSLTLKASAHVAMPRGWKLFIYRDLIGPTLGAPGPSACNAVMRRCFPGPPGHHGRFKPPYVCGPTTSARCGPVVVPGRQVTSTVYETLRAVVQTPSGESFEASFYVRWHP